jgi:transcriptional regulator with XRE-family HTH domain
MSELHTKFGDLLKLERERQELSLEAVSGELKIPESTLGHIENGEADSLPSELYFKLFSKSYAEFLGIDFTKTLEAIQEEIGIPLEPSLNGEARPTKAKAEGEASDEPQEPADEEKDLKATLKRVGILAGVIIGGFIVLLVGYKLLFSSDSGSDLSGAGESGQAEASSGNKGGQGSDQATAAFDWNVPDYHPADSIVMILAPRDASWATVLADGDTAIYQTLTPGRRYLATAKYRLLVSIGVPRVVDVELDGQPAYLASAESGRISRVEIDQTNRDQFNSPPQRRTAPSTRKVEQTEEPPTSGDSANIDNGETN